MVIGKMRLAGWKEIIFLSLVLLSQQVLAQVQLSGLTLADGQCACVQGQPQLFENPQKFNFGWFASQCVDSCKFRNLQRVATLTENVLVANLLHQGTFWKALVPAQAQSIEVGFEKFAPGTYHFFLRFHFSEGQAVQLFALDDQTMQHPAARVNNLVLSIEGVPPKGSAYSLSSSVWGNYLIVYRLFSAQQAHDLMVVQKNHPVIFYPLNFSRGESSAILQRAFDVGEKEGLHTTYSLLSRNCATTAVSLFAAAGRPISSTFHHFIGTLAVPFPIDFPLNTMRALQQFGYMD